MTLEEAINHAAHMVRIRPDGFDRDLAGFFLEREERHDLIQEAEEGRARSHAMAEERRQYNLEKTRAVPQDRLS